jgi:hypothetical protein
MTPIIFNFGPRWGWLVSFNRLPIYWRENATGTQWIRGRLASNSVWTLWRERWMPCHIGNPTAIPRTSNLQPRHYPGSPYSTLLHVPYKSPLSLGLRRALFSTARTALGISVYLCLFLVCVVLRRQRFCDCRQSRFRNTENGGCVSP